MKSRKYIRNNFTGILVCAMALLQGCASISLTNNPGTLINWHEKRIDDETFLKLKPNESYASFTDCSIRIYRTPDAPSDIGFLQFIEPTDLELFQGRFPQFNVSVFSSSKKKLPEHKFSNRGTSSQRHRLEGIQIGIT